MRLYLRTVRKLLGRAESSEDEYWKSPKAEQVLEHTAPEVRGEVERHIRGLGQRYFAAYAPPQIARHIEAAVQSKRDGLVVDAVHDPATGTTELIVCTRDRTGVFNAIAGALSSQLINVIGAAAFTAPDGVVVDSFTVSDARNGTPLTQAQIERIEQTLHAVLVDGDRIGDYMERARKKIFSLLQPKVPTRTRVHFDNDSSRTHTVIDIETGDRTGLLYDLSKMMSSADLDIASSRIVTDARRARDSFYVTRDGRKLTEAGEQRELESAILTAIHGERAGTPAEVAT
jgi:[protein-PII] uridylyltransferase